MLLHEPNRVITFAFPRTSTALPLQVKVSVWSLSVIRIVPALAGGGCRVGGTSVSDNEVGDAMPSKDVVTVGVTVLGVIVSVAIGVTVAELHAGPVISPIATSGPF